MIELVAFDLDGTLVESAAEISATVGDVLQFYGLPGPPEATIRNWIGLGARETMARAYAHCAAAEAPTTETQPLDANYLDSIMVKYARFHTARCGTQSHLFPKVRESLVRLRAECVNLAVVTNKEERFARQLLGAHGLSEFFDPIVGGDTLLSRKPDPTPLRYCLEFHGVPPARALMVGDSDIDVRTARAAGVPCWVLPYGYNRGAPIAASQPDAVIESIAEVVEFVLRGDVTAARAPA
jgi:phosphoglycolate phosphatase